MAYSILLTGDDALKEELIKSVRNAELNSSEKRILRGAVHEAPIFHHDAHSGW